MIYCNSERPHAPQRSPLAAGFTLVELLVSIGILVLLIAILLPAISKARSSASKAACLSNLRQVYGGFSIYASYNDDQAPIGFRTISKQYNSMVFSVTAGPSGKWVLFGLVYNAGYLPTPRVLFCPSETNPKFQMGTTSNPWPAPNAAPSTNVQAGYAARPTIQIPDDLTVLPAGTPRPFHLPRLSDLGSKAILADLTASADRVATRHKDGDNVLFGDGSARWVPLSVFDQPAATWPDPTVPPSSTYNATQDVIWTAFDGA